MDMFDKWIEENPSLKEIFQSATKHLEDAMDQEREKYQEDKDRKKYTSDYGMFILNFRNELADFLTAIALEANVKTEIGLCPSQGARDLADFRNLVEMSYKLTGFLEKSQSELDIHISNETNQIK
jgi:hypothetical protein